MRLRRDLAERVDGLACAPAHFAERHGLVLIIALGEAFISIGIGVTGIGIGLGEVVAAILGLLVATSFWLAYFDFFSIRGEPILPARGAERVAFARDVYSYAHFPMIVGIVLFAFAMKTIIGDIGDELDAVAAFALCGGSALYLLTYSAIRMRLDHRLTVSRGRFVAALVFLLVLPLATAVPALAALAIVTAVWLALNAYELVWWREARAESRSVLASSCDLARPIDSSNYRESIELWSGPTNSGSSHRISSPSPTRTSGARPPSRSPSTRMTRWSASRCVPPRRRRGRRLHTRARHGPRLHPRPPDDR